MPRKMRRAALRSALSVKAADNEIVVVEDLSISEPKTSLMAKTLNNLVGQATALVLIPAKDGSTDMAVRSLDNIPTAKMLLASYLNIRDLLGYDKVILPLAALEVIESYLG